MANPWASLARNAARGDLFHIIDTETTGSSPPKSRVIEVACATLQHGRVVDRFETLIDPGVPIPSFITRLTGITTAMTRGQAKPADAMAAFAAYLAARPGHFVAHNAGFDYRFLEYEFEQARVPWPFQGRYCTVRLSRACNPQLPRHNLDTLIKHYGVVMKDRHRAMADVNATATAFWRMVETLEGAETPIAPWCPDPVDETPPEDPEPALDVVLTAAQLGADQRVARAAAVPPGPSALPPGAWRQVLRRVQQDSRTLAAMLEQHGALGDPGPDGALVVALREPFLGRMDAGRVARLEVAIEEILGPGVAVRLVAQAAPVPAGT